MSISQLLFEVPWLVHLLKVSLPEHLGLSFLATVSLAAEAVLVSLALLHLKLVWLESGFIPWHCKLVRHNVSCLENEGRNDVSSTLVERGLRLPIQGLAQATDMLWAFGIVKS